MSYTRLASAFAFSLSLAVAGCSGGSTTLTPASTTSTNGTDVGFINGAGMSSNAEIGAAQFALTRSSNSDVLAFAQLMITDHGAENAALAPIATQVGHPAPTSIGPAMQAVAAMLAPLSGPTFDKAYVNSEIMGHSNNLNNNYTPELTSGLNTSVINYAKKYQPQVQSHLSIITGIKAKYGF